MELAEQLMEDIARFKRERGVDRCVAVWCGSTETWRAPTAVHASLAAFEEGLRASSDDIAPSATVIRRTSACACTARCRGCTAPSSWRAATTWKPPATRA
jgi:hypothetical protein